MNIFAKELAKIKTANQGKQPFEFDINRKIRELQNKVDELSNKLSKTAQIIH